MTKPTGYILWEGLSKFDNTPIVVIATLKTTNRKTGDMVQTWILPQNSHPGTGFKENSCDLATRELQPTNKTICGDCRHLKDRSCYVNWGQAPTSIWRAYKAKSYPKLDAEGILALSGRRIRFGSAGDPAMAPLSVWQQLAEFASEHTGYTHQWRQEWAQGLKPFVQASVDSFAEYLDASAHGWKCFRVLRPGEDRHADEVHCRASSEMGNKTDCATCHLCDGASANVVINVHGSRAASYA